jgi:hypothetical protein
VISSADPNVIAVPGSPVPRGEPDLNCAAIADPLSSCQSFEYPRVGGTSQQAIGTTPIADHFRTHAAFGVQSITSACWWGTYGTTCAAGNPPAGVDDFELRYYARDPDGTPGATAIATFRQSLGQLTVTRRDIPCDAGGRLTTEYTATHAGVSVDPDTCYFIEMRNFFIAPAVNWFWSRTAPATDGHCLRDASNDGYTVEIDTILDDRAFCLNVQLDVFGTQAVCYVPPPPICTNDPANGQPITVLTTGFRTASPNSPGWTGQALFQGADAFSFPSAGNVSSVCFWGFWIAADATQPGGPAAPDFDITYYTPSGNAQPGPIHASFHVGDAGVNVFREGTRYRIEHPPVAFAANTCYFMSISRVVNGADPEHNILFIWGLTQQGSIGNNMINFRAVPPNAWGNLTFAPPNDVLSNYGFQFDHGPAIAPVCPISTGACCTGLTCTIVTQVACTGGGGVYQGNGTTCNADSCRTPPPNDNCANATAISGTGTFPFDNRGATLDQAIDPSCASASPSSHDVWFAWTAGCDGTYTLESCGEAVNDTVYSVHPSCGATEIVCDDDGCLVGGGPSTVTFAATANQTLLFRIATWNATPGSAETFTVSRDGGDCGPSCP